MRAGLLEHGDSIPVPRSAGKTEGSVALSGKSAARLQQCWLAQLDIISKAGSFEHSCAGSVLEFGRPELAREHWRLSQSALAGRADLAAHEPCAVQTGITAARAAQGRKDRTSSDAVRIVRTQNSRSALADAGWGRIRCSARYRSDYRKPVAAWLRIRIQSAVRSGVARGPGAAHPRAQTIRQNCHRQQRFGRHGIYRCSDGSG